MPVVFTAEDIIHRSADEIWAVLTDWEKAPRWMSGIDRMSVHGEFMIGAELVFHARGKERISTVANLEVGKLLGLRSTQGGVTADYTYTLAPLNPDSTRVTLVANCQTRGLFWLLISPLLRLAIRLTDRGQVTALKQVIEQENNVDSEGE